MSNKKKSTEFNRILLYGVIIIALVLMGYYGFKSISGSSAINSINIDGNLINGPLPLSSDVSVSLDPASPSSSIVLAGTQNNEVARFRFRAVNEAFTVKTLSLLIPESKDITFGTQTNWSSVKNLKITYPDKTGQLITKAQAVASVKIKFTNLDLYVPKNGTATMSVKADFHEISTEPAKFGDRIKIGFASGATLGDFYAVGADTGKTDQRASVADVYAKEHIVYKSMITVEEDPSGLNGVLVPGAKNALYKFKTTASTNGPVAIKRFTFAIRVIDNGTTSATVDLGGFAINRNGVDLTNVSFISGVSGNADNTSAVARTSMETKGTNDIEGNSGLTWVTVLFGNDPSKVGGEQPIEAGGKAYWKLEGDAGVGFSGIEDDSIEVELIGDKILPKINAYYLHDIDVTLGEFSAVLGTIKAGLTDNSPVLLWSDWSAIANSDALPDNAGIAKTPLSTGDWTNSALIKSFPLKVYKLVA